jgi:zinc/manganese transport system substrate-binding protein
MRSLIFALSLFTGLAQAQPMKLASLHPILADIARQVGGDRVEVIDLLKPGGDSHHFEPNAKDLANIKDAKLVLASGKHLESYLDKLRDSIGPVPILEVGRTIPSITLAPGSELFLCCPAHAVGGIDPHWWHSTENVQRAARVIGDALTAADPSGKDAYKAGVTTYRNKIASLKAWAVAQISVIPRSDRKLVTGHAAFGYFCKEFGFKSLPLLGLGREDQASAQHIAESIQTIREHKIRAAFPEDQANPKILNEIVRETGIKRGEELIADGTSIEVHTFEAMLTHNVKAIVAVLKP